MNTLEEQYNSYLELISKKEKINKELLSLSGKNDTDSVKKMNSLSSELGLIVKELYKYNTDLLNKVEAYFNIKEQFDKVCNEIRKCEKNSKKSKDEKEIVMSAEGRNKKINKGLINEYKELVEQKKKIRIAIREKYQEIAEITSIVKDIKEEEEKPLIAEPQGYILPKIITYDDLSNEDKIKETKKRLERIFNLSTLPNQGKKILVTYEDKKRPIAKKYQGLFHETLKELRILESSLKKDLSEQESLPEAKIDTIHSNAVKYAEKFGYREKNNFEFSSKEDEKIFYELFSNCPKYKQEEIYKRLFSNEAIIKRNELINRLTRQMELEPTLKQIINTAKVRVIQIPKKIKNKISSIGNKLKQKQEEVEYEVINRKVNFKNNTCQKISEKKSKICEISKEKLEKVKEIYNGVKAKIEYANEKRKYSKTELFEMVKELKKENEEQAKIIAQQQAKIKKLTPSGYVATGILTVIGVVALAIIIFIIISKIV